MGKTSRRKNSTSKSSSAPQVVKCLPYSGPENPKLDEEGKVKQWSATCRDGKDLKIYLEYGCCDDLSPAQVRSKYQQFSKYSKYDANHKVCA